MLHSALHLGNPALDIHELLFAVATVSVMVGNVFLYIGLFLYYHNTKEAKLSLKMKLCRNI